MRPSPLKMSWGIDKSFLILSIFMEIMFVAERHFHMHLHVCRRANPFPLAVVESAPQKDAAAGKISGKYKVTGSMYKVLTLFL